MSLAPSNAGTHERARLLRRGVRLEYATLGWNVVGCLVLAAAAITVGSVALAGFGIDSLIEIVASLVVVWQLRETDDPSRTRIALYIISVAFGLLAIYIAVQSLIVLVGVSNHPGRSIPGAVWLALTVAIMLALAHGKADTGRRLDNLVLRTEARITAIDAILAGVVLIGVALNVVGGLWWTDPVAAVVLVFYSAREARHAWHEATDGRTVT